MKPEDIAAGAKQFAATEWGKWFISELERREKDHVKSARKAPAHEFSVNEVMRADGVHEALEIITSNVEVANSNLFKK